MFTKKKLIISMLLVAVIVAGMVIPAFASVTGSGTLGSYAYKWEVTNTHSVAYAQISSSGQPTELKAKIIAKLYYDLTDESFVKSDGYTTGYAGVTASVTNIVTTNNVPVRAEIQLAYGSFCVGSTCVAQNILAD